MLFSLLVIDSRNAIPVHTSHAHVTRVGNCNC